VGEFSSHPRLPLGAGKRETSFGEVTVEGRIRTLKLRGKPKVSIVLKSALGYPDRVKVIMSGIGSNRMQPNHLEQEFHCFKKGYKHS
jgi:hypothetical protein